MKATLFENNVNNTGHDRNTFFSNAEECLKLCQALVGGYDDERALYKLADETGDKTEHETIVSKLGNLFEDAAKYTLVIEATEKDGKIVYEKATKTGADIKKAIEKYGKFNPKGKLVYGGTRRTQAAFILMAFGIKLVAAKATVRKFESPTDRLQAAIADNVGRTIGARNYNGADIVRIVRMLWQGGVSWYKTSDIVNRPWSEVQRVKELVTLDVEYRAGIESAIVANDGLYKSLDKEILRKFREACVEGKHENAEKVAIETKDGESLSFVEYMTDPKAGRQKYRGNPQSGSKDAIDTKSVTHAMTSTSSKFVKDLLKELTSGNLSGILATINQNPDAFDKAAFTACGME